MIQGSKDIHNLKNGKERQRVRATQRQTERYLD